MKEGEFEDKEEMGPERWEEDNQKRQHSPLYNAAWELFREMQHLQPDRLAICAAINTKLGKDCCSPAVLGKFRPVGWQARWLPRSML